MGFYEILDQVQELLRHRKRVSYRALKREFHLDDEYIEDLKEELIYSQKLAIEEDGRVLVWSAESQTPSATPHRLEAERRQLTVMFCDLVESTSLSERLDPEDLRDIIRAYQQVCAEVIQHYDGHIAQYLGDGLLVYFGYPAAHEDDAHRAVRTGLGILQALETLNTRLEQTKGIRLAVRVGIHTGLVVVGEMGGGGRQEQLALGDTPNIAARLQGLAAPNTLVMSAATYQLVQGYFACQEMGEQALKGVSQPLKAYQARREHDPQSRLDAGGRRGLTPLVGRDVEIALLLERWKQVKDEHGQVVVLNGEAGIGKSRLVQALKGHLVGETHARQECCCSPYHTNSAFFPVIELLQRTLDWQQDDTPEAKLRKLETVLTQKHLDLDKAIPLFTSLLSLPLPDDRYAPLLLSSQQQRQQTLQTLVTIFSELAAQHPVLFIVEDLHWIDPSTLELLDLLIERTPTVPVFMLCTCRPTFQPPWAQRAHVTSVTLERLPHRHVEQIIAQVTQGKSLPAEVREQIVTKTDGIPLFVEEMTKAMLESGHLKAVNGQYELVGALPAFAIPTTLHDSLMARLDRLVTAKGVAQLGATIGRQFSYALLRAITPLDETTLQRELNRLVEAELLQQHGPPPQATYLFKHALIQDAAYQSLLKRTRQQYHQRIVEALEEGFRHTAETQPELLAHHYTEAGLHAQAVVAWQRAGEHAVERSAHAEAIGHFHKGLALLATLPDTLERTQQELVLRIALGRVLMATKGQGAPEVERVFAQAYELCQGLEATPQLFPVLGGLCGFYAMRGQLQTARELGGQLVALAQRQSDPVLLLHAHQALGGILFHLGDIADARTHVEQAIVFYGPQPHRSLDTPGHDVGVVCLSYLALSLWLLGYPDQALQKNNEALALTQELSHPFSIVHALMRTSLLHIFHRDWQVVYEASETIIHLAAEQEFTQWVAAGVILRGLGRAKQGQIEDGLAQMRQGLERWRATGAELIVPYFLVQLAELYGAAGQAETGLSMLAETEALTRRTGEHFWDAELYRLKGELLLQQSVPAAHQAEAFLHQAFALARRQQTKSLQLRAAMSLSRLWQQQGKSAAARQQLVEVYHWFTEGLDTADLQAARSLLETLR